MISFRKQKGVSKAWLGLHRDEQGPQSYWKWTDQSVFDYDQPPLYVDEGQQKNCMNLNLTDKLFSRTFYNDTHNYLCKANQGNICYQL